MEAKLSTRSHLQSLRGKIQKMRDHTYEIQELSKSLMLEAASTSHVDTRDWESLDHHEMVLMAVWAANVFQATSTGSGTSMLDGILRMHVGTSDMLQRESIRNRGF